MDIRQQNSFLFRDATFGSLPTGTRQWDMAARLAPRRGPGWPRRLLGRFWQWLLAPVPFPRDHWWQKTTPAAPDAATSAHAMNPSFREPPFRVGLWIVAGVFGGLGVMAGLMVSLFVGHAGLCTGLGGGLGFLGGLLFEAWPWDNEAARKNPCRPA